MITWRLKHVLRNNYRNFSIIFSVLYIFVRSYTGYFSFSRLFELSSESDIRIIVWNSYLVVHFSTWKKINPAPVLSFFSEIHTYELYLTFSMACLNFICHSKLIWTWRAEAPLHEDPAWLMHILKKVDLCSS